METTSPPNVEADAVAPPARPWWGDYELGDAGVGVWQIGDLWMQVQRDAGELLLTTGQDPDSGSISCRFETTLRDADQPPVARFVGVTGPIQLRPALLDRTVVARPVSAVGIAPGSVGSFFLSTPVFIEWMAQDRVLYRVPAVRLRKTWIGETPREGELAYATRSNARTVRDRVIEHPARAITQVDVSNEGQEMVWLEKVHLPMPQLALYASSAHGLWTAGMRLRAVDGAIVEARVLNHAPTAVGETVQLSAAAQAVDRGHLRRMFGALLNGPSKSGWPA